MIFMISFVLGIVLLTGGYFLYTFIITLTPSDCFFYGCLNVITSFILEYYRLKPSLHDPLTSTIGLILMLMLLTGITLVSCGVVKLLQLKNNSKKTVESQK